MSSIDVFLQNFYIFVLSIPLSLIGVEIIRAKKISKITLFTCLFIHILLNFSAFTLAGITPEKNAFLTIKILQGILFIIIFWMLVGNRIKNPLKTLPIIKPNILLAAIAFIILWINQYKQMTAEQFFFLWRMLSVLIFGFLINKYIQKETKLFFLILAAWFFMPSFSLYLSPVYYLLLSAAILKEAGSDALRVNKVRNQLLREKETIFKLINDIGTSVRDIRKSDDTLKLVLHSAIEAVHAQAGAIYIYEGDNQENLLANVVEGPFTPLHASNVSYKAKETLVDADAGTVNKTLLQEREQKIGECVIELLSETQDGALVIDNAKTNEKIKKIGGTALNFYTIAAVQIKIKEELLGTLVCINKQSGQKFKDNDLSVLQTLADQAALSVNNAWLYSNLSEQERMHHELEIAKEIQLRLLPKSLPTVNGIQIAADMETAREVGGDYYDCIKLDDDSAGIVIGDVAGKGLPAGMIVLIIRTVLHILVHQKLTTKEIISGLSSRVYSQMESREFMTFIYMVWDARRKVMQYTSAGHEHILHYQAVKKKLHRIRSGGIAIGMHPDIEQFTEQKEIKMDTNDIIVLYTDGITEAKSSDGTMYGLDRLQEMVENNNTKNPEEIKDKVLKDVAEFVGEEEQYDDQTLVVCKIE